MRFALTFALIVALAPPLAAADEPERATVTSRADVEARGLAPVEVLPDAEGGAFILAGARS